VSAARVPQYPVYVISKGRAFLPLTARMFVKERIPYRIVVEEPEADEYRAELGDAVLVLPFQDLGFAPPARNWCWEHALASGAKRHWMFDDNIRSFQRWHEGRRLNLDAALAMSLMEDFTERYTNIGISGPNYVMFGTGTQAPFLVNTRVYSSQLIRNDLPYRWRGQYNADTDLSLQVLSGGLCTVLFNAFLIEKMTTMKMGGGSTGNHAGDGRLRMARSLEHQWPGIVSTSRRFDRPQHQVAFNWRRFDTPLIRRDDLDWDALADAKPDMRLRRTRPARPATKRFAIGQRVLQFLIDHEGEQLTTEAIIDGVIDVNLPRQVSGAISGVRNKGYVVDRVGPGTYVFRGKVDA
jgi:hypothetical protein